MSQFDILLIAHLVGDYLFQTNWMALNKAEKWLPLIIHSFVYTAIVWAISYLGFSGLSWKACVFIFITHVILDRRSLLLFWCKHIMGLKEGKPFWLVIMADQTLHLIILAVSLRL